MSERRRLAAIVAADVVGYSRLMGRDETGTLAALNAVRRDIVDPRIATHGGRIVKTTGDGLLLEFPSVVDAVRCVVAVQSAMAEHGAAVAEDRRIALRIGVHLGDVIVEGDDIFGDGVNIAARLEGVAEPGGICLSDDAYRQIQGKIEAGFDDLGPQALKNIARPVTAWRLRIGGVGAPAVAPALALPDKPSIAVLPFQNMSGDPEQEYFADGMVEDIITALSRFKSLFVIARNSSFTYKGRAVDIKQVGRELGVRYVLEGSVRKAGDKVRITGQLIDSATGTHLWADRFDGALEEVFELQDRVATSVIGAIVPTVDRAEMGRIRRKPVDNPDAYDCYLRARVRTSEPTRDAITEALDLCYRAIELDPGFAGPHGMAALSYAIRKTQGWVVDRNREEAEVRRLAARVSQIGHDDALALCYAGHAVGWVCRDLEMAAALIDRGLLINPNLATAWAERSMVSLALGQHEAAIEQVNQALRLSPVDTRRWFADMMMAYALLMLGRFSEVLDWTARGLAQRPQNTVLMLASAAATAFSGDTDQARRIARAAIELNPALRLANLGDFFAFRQPRDMDRMIEGLRLAGLPE